jgi:uncharacterized membrane protein
MRALTDGSLGSFGAWWIALTLCGLLAWPLCAVLFPGSKDRGYLAAKAVGLLLATHVAWLASSLGLLSFARSGVLAGLAVLVLLNAALLNGRLPLPLRGIARRELFFVVFLAIGTIIRVTNPDIYGLEKFMDFGFMNAGMRADAMPPPDMWYGGEPINYYYFGHITASWLALATGVPADHGYNLMMATVFALVASLIYALVRDALPEAQPNISRVMAALTAACVVLGGNFHTVVYGAFRHWAGSQTGRDYYYYPDSTRYIGFDPPTDDKAFTEMPAYGFAVGDMHGHVLNLTVNMLLLFVLFHAVAPKGSDQPPHARLKTEHLIAMGFLLGLSIMTNTWDFVLYGLVITLVGLLAWLSAPVLSATALLRLFFQGLGLVAVALVVAMPFLASFQPFGEGVRLVEKTTPVWQWLVLYTNLLPGCLAAITAYAFFRQKQGTAVFAAALAASCLAILILPEIIYLKDIYGSDHARANTMFKFTFQGQTIGIIAAGITTGLLLGKLKGRYSQALPFVIAAPLLMPLIYPNYWLKDRVANNPLHKLSLSGLDFVAREAPGEEELMPIVRSLVLEPGQRILEADGNSYSYAARFSALTGQPTPLGWRNHQWLWRGDWNTVAALAGRVGEAYRAPNSQKACEMLKALSVRYVIIGDVERKTYPDLREDVFQSIGRERAAAGNTRIYEIETRACEGV